MIIRIVKLSLKEECVDLFKTYFDTVNEIIRNQPNCEKLQAWQEINQPTIFFTYSIWNSEQDLNNYRDSEFFLQFWKTVKPWFAEKAAAWTFDKIVDI
jgi:autoinducer 2-degrading protein